MTKTEEQILQQIEDVKQGKLKAVKTASLPVEEAKIEKIDYVKENIRRLNTVRPGQIIHRKKSVFIEEV